MPSPAVFVPLPFSRFPKKLEHNEPNNMLRNLLFFFFLFSVVSLAPFINKSNSSRDLTIYMIPLIFSFKIIRFVCFAKSEGRVHDPYIFL